jgi:hypothetical protein
MRKVLREPLIHFLVLGAVLFLVFDLTRETDQPGEQRIVVTPGQVEQLASQFSRTWLRDPTPAELDGLVERYVRSEIYYREALAMGLGQDDPYVRNRLALKLEVLLDDLSAEVEPSDEALARFLEEHAERFAEPARLSFRQVYVNPDRHPAPAAEAERLLELLRGGADPAGLGDVPMLTPGLDAARRDEIAREFGGEFTDALAELEAGGWVGPLPSPFGLHLVLVTAHEPGRQPALSEVREEVLAEWRDQRRREAKEQAYLGLRERYEVVVEPAMPTGQQDGAVAAAQASEAEPQTAQTRP